MPATIQKILKPTKYRAVDTSGNNNHGQIYSGRALEFDGVSDYLDTGYVFSSTAHTICVWAKVNDNALNKHIFGARDVNNDGILLFYNDDEKICYYVNHTDIETTINNEFNNTWVRIVATSDGSTQSLYINGVLHTSQSISETVSVTTNAKIGARNFNLLESYFDGLLSDLQVWDTGFTASDALYDYRNPEFLALNNSGTSLTESNLKLWYPMQDGHKGQQSYVMDGANTGARELLPTTYQTSSDESASNWANNNGSTVVHSESDGGLVFSGGAEGTSNQYLWLTTSSSSGYANLSENLEEGQSYKATVDIKFKSGNGAGLKIHGGSTQYATTGNITDSSFVTNELFWTQGSDTVKLQATGLGTGEKMVVNNISIKAINTKHHATTVFKGGELVTNGDFEAGDATVNTITRNLSDAASFGASSDVANGGSKSGKVTADADSQNPSVEWRDGSDMGLTSGRTYKISADVFIPTSQQMDLITLQVIANNGSTNLVSTSTASAVNSWQTLTGTFVDDDISKFKFIGSKDGGGDVDNEVYYIDNLSIKEVGTATGWTDADQQLDIPQTALQSYNQLAWFGENDAEKISCGSDSSIDTIWAGGGTASAWFYAHDEGNGTYGRVIDKVDWYIMLSNVSGSTCTLTFKHNCTGTNVNWRSSSTVIEFGKWYHVAVAWNSDSITNTPAMYLNGELVDASNVDGTPSGDLTSEASDNLTIGNTNAGTRTFNGCITEVSMWNDLFTQAEVNELYNDGKALYAKDHSAWSLTNLKGYWQNNGLATWTDLGNYGNDGSVDASVTETLLLPAGVDSSRDTQGFLMNREKTTNELNLYTPSYLDTSPASNKESPYVYIPKAPLMTSSTAVTNFSICSWIKFHATPSETAKEAVIYDDVQEYDDNFAKGLKFSITSGNAVKCDVWWGERNDGSNKDRIYCNYDLDNIDESTITNPHSFDANGMWNGTQTSMGTSKGIGYDSALMNSGNLPRNQWFHLAITFDHDNSESQTSSTGDHTSNNASNITNEAPFYIYVNGILVGKEGLDSNDDEAVADNFDKTMMGVADHAAILGSDMQSNLPQPGNNANDTWGSIDDLLIYSDTLTSREVLRIYNAGKRSHR